ncbi:MAG: superoxide dismutase [Fe] [Campylobacteraceae bacterium 4484_4]|nr:MAG: superoxide dismutase [Fe] [Campylobacteraceae bacterium 4484_4]
MKHHLPELPYGMNALEPFLSKETLEYHYGKHHAAYVANLNRLIEGTDYETMSLEYIITQSEGSLFNNAAQTFNHNFYWECLTPEKTRPSETLEHALTETFGSIEQFKKAFSEAAASLFGSGWTWLILDPHEHLQIVNKSNADTPIVHRHTPLLTLDVWEHAYYIDYRNARAAYIEKFWDFVNWKTMSRIYEEKEHTNIPGLSAIPNNDPDDPMADYLDEMQQDEEAST